MGLAQLTWERREPDRLAIRISGGYQRSRLDPAPAATMPYIDSVRDGAILPLLLQPLGTASSLRLEADLSSRPGSTGANHWRLGLSAGRDRMRPNLLTAPGAVETVNGAAARVWVFDDSRGTPTWRQPNATIYAADTLSIGRRLNLDGSVRLETIVHRTDGDARRLDGRVSTRLRDLGAGARRWRVGLRRRGDVGWAARADGAGVWGPLAPSGHVYRWTDTNLDGIAQPDEYGTLIARSGRAHGIPGATGIDPSLKRPRRTETVFGLAIDRERWTTSLTGIVRRERNLPQVVDTVRRTRRSKSRMTA